MSAISHKVWARNSLVAKVVWVVVRYIAGRMLLVRIYLEHISKRTYSTPYIDSNKLFMSGIGWNQPTVGLPKKRAEAIRPLCITLIEVRYPLILHIIWNTKIVVTCMYV